MPRRQIGGYMFEVAQLPAMRSFLLQPKLAPILAEVAAALLGIIETVPDDEPEPAPEGGDNDTPATPAVQPPQGIKERLAKMTTEDILEIDLGKHAGSIVASVTRLSQLLRPKELEYITRELLDSATMDGKTLLGTKGQGEMIDSLLMGQTLLIWQLLFYAVQVNYPDVFSLRAAPAATAPANPSAASSTSHP